MPKPKKSVIGKSIDCGFAIIDVKRGRKALAKRLARGEEIEFVMRGKLFNGKPWSKDDGVSIEFAADVETIVETKEDILV